MQNLDILLTLWALSFLLVWRLVARGTESTDSHTNKTVQTEDIDVIEPTQHARDATLYWYAKCKSEGKVP